MAIPTKDMSEKTPLVCEFSEKSALLLSTPVQ